jgi:hypothetical protein
VAEEQGRRQWTGRPWVARAIRLVVYLVPFAASVGFAWLLSSALPPVSTMPAAIVRWLLIAAASTGVMIAFDHLSRRLLPLAVLYGLTLAFPDQAPSRFRIAMRTGTTLQLRKVIADARAGRVGETPAEAAEKLLELVAALSLHDRLTRGHSERVRAYTHLIGEELGIGGNELDRLRWAALLHDIGKLLIDAAILNKPGRLTEAEYGVIKQHPDFGRELVAPLEGWLGPAAQAVWQHHERWDGGGYPRGLAGTDISLAARVVAVADAFDVMTSARSYKEPMPATAARAELARCAGTHFDAAVVRAFLNVSLGRLRMAMGPLSWLTQLSFVPQALVGAGASGATAMTAVVGLGAGAIGVGLGDGVISAAGSGTPGARGAAVTATVNTTTTTTTATLPAGAVDGAPVTTAPVPPAGSVPAGRSPTTTSPRGAVSTSTLAPATTDPDGGGGGPGGTGRPGATTTVPRAVSTTSAPPDGGTAAPPAGGTSVSTAPASTAPPGATTLPTAAPPPSSAPATSPTTPPTSAATTTTAPPPTTVTTTTAPPAAMPGLTLYLTSPGAGAVASQPVLPLATATPTALLVANYDTDRNADPGLTLARGGGEGVGSQRFRWTAAANVRFTGSIDVRLFVTGPGLLNTANLVVDAELRRCGPSTCTTLASAQRTSPGPLLGLPLLWGEVALPLGAIDTVLAAGDALELVVSAAPSSSRDVWLGYDATVAASRLAFDPV